MEGLIAENRPKPDRDHEDEMLGVKAFALRPCCEKTIERHASFNSMMVCGDCCRMIKTYSDIEAFKRYVRFCVSRKREIFVAEHCGYRVVTFSDFSAGKPAASIS